MCEQCPPHPCPCTTSPCREAAMVTVKPGVWCDPCIASLVAALNYGGVETVASCCGHGEQAGSIALADGRELVVVAQSERLQDAWHQEQIDLALEWLLCFAAGESRPLPGDNWIPVAIDALRLCGATDARKAER